MSNRKRIYQSVQERIEQVSLEDAADFIFKDTLSNCRNERYLNELIELENSASENAAIVMIDVSAFKLIDLNYGVVFGQKVLRKLGNFLLSYFKPTDEVIRYYGDVFVVVLYNTTPDALLMRIGDVISEVEALEFSQHPEVALKIVAGGCLTNELNHEALADADAMLHKAKTQDCKFIVEQLNSSWSKEFVIR